MRAATVAIQFESPKLAAVSYLNGADDFADRLDRAIQYMESRMKLVEHRPLPDNPDNDQE
jgi:hypothetical protein